MQHDYDVVIVGAGMVGASFACIIAPKNLSIALIEPVEISNNEQPSYDDRGISLSPSSKRILEYIGLWEEINEYVTPIKKIHVSNQKKFGFTHFAASDVEATELGHVVIARSLGNALHKKIKKFKNITLLCPANYKVLQGTIQSYLYKFYLQEVQKLYIQNYLLAQTVVILWLGS